MDKYRILKNGIKYYQKVKEKAEEGYEQAKKVYEDIHNTVQENMKNEKEQELAVKETYILIGYNYSINRHGYNIQPIRKYITYDNDVFYDVLVSHSAQTNTNKFLMLSEEHFNILKEKGWEYFSDNFDV